MEERALTYQAEDQQITLTPSIVRQLVRGGGALSPFELMTALHLCKTRGLNPFVGDVYLIKYGSDPLALVVSIDFLRARARSSADCTGWSVGVIVQDKDGKLNYTNGLVPPDSVLLGGWAEAQPASWSVVRRVEVNVDAYVKKTREGKSTKFWTEEMRPTMIMKVAEAQLLRAVWPRLVSKFYLAEELGQEVDDIPTLNGVTGKPEVDETCQEAVANIKQAFPGAEEVNPVPEPDPENIYREFIDWIRLIGLPEIEVGRFVAYNSERSSGKPAHEIMARALNNRDEFLKFFKRWLNAKQAREAQQTKKPAEDQMPLPLSGEEGEPDVPESA